MSIVFAAKWSKRMFHCNQFCWGGKQIIVLEIETKCTQTTTKAENNKWDKQDLSRVVTFWAEIQT